MADITMCNNKTCDNREKCYRFTATPNEWRQSYFYKDPEPTISVNSLDGETFDCEHFYPNDIKS